MQPHKQHLILFVESSCHYPRFRKQQPCNCYSPNSKKNYFKSDTIYNTKDSVKIFFLNQQGKVIKEEKTTYYRNPAPGSYVKLDSTINYYNSLGKLVFIEGWGFDIGSSFDDPEQGMITLITTGYPFRNLLARFEYDNLNRPTYEVFLLKFAGRFFRTRLFYNLNGELKDSVTENIFECEFWD